LGESKSNRVCKPVEGGRSAGSLAWAGINNTFFWIDPPRKTCAVIMMQFLPFSDDAAISTVENFERAVYADSAEKAAKGSK
jgi:CubicO group peptidase (beta-lactamase class C family)